MELGLTAQQEVALRKIRERIHKLGMEKWLKAVELGPRQLGLGVDQEALEAEKKLDGCYVIKTDLTPIPLN